MNRMRQLRRANMDNVSEIVDASMPGETAPAGHAATGTSRSGIRHDWSAVEVETLLGLPFNDLLFRAQIVHRRHFDANRVQMSTLLSIKTGGCPEDCASCPQSARYDTGVGAEKLMAVDAAVARAKRAKAEGACCSA